MVRVLQSSCVIMFGASLWMIFLLVYPSVSSKFVVGQKVRIMGTSHEVTVVSIGPGSWVGVVYEDKAGQIHIKTVNSSIVQPLVGGE